MSKQGEPGDDSGDAAARRPIKPPFDKVKSDSEGPLEKAKFEGEKLPEKVKPEVEKQPEKLKQEIEKPREKVKPEFEKVPEKLIKETDKPFEKVKSDDEKLPEKLIKEIEKVKSDHEKLPEKAKHEKEKREKEVREDRFDDTAGAAALWNQSTGGDQLPLDREALLQVADELERTGRELRHFIEQADRPDLTRGALAHEPDQQDSDSDKA